MSPLSRFAIFGYALAALALAPCRADDKVVSDLAPPDRRRAFVDSAERLARAPTPAAIPADVTDPFNPPNFSQPDPSEVSQNRAPSAAPASGGSAVPGTPAAPATDRDVLEAVADKIPTTGTIILGGKPLLISGTNRIEVGSRFTVVYNGQEYELELTAIDRTTFTVRYKGEEFTRPIKLGKSP